MEDFRSHYLHHRATYIFMGALVLLIMGWGVVHVTRAYFTGHGNILIRDVPAGTIVKVDGRTIQEVERGVSTIRTDLAPGEHTVTLGRERHWPWSKTLAIHKDRTTVITPFFISRLSVRTAVNATHTERPIAERLFANTAQPTREHPILSTDETVALWNEGQSVIALWREGATTTPHFFCVTTCLQKRTVLTTAAPIEHIAFLGDRNDVMLFANSEGIFALELDMRDIQNFQPVLEGAGLDFRVRDTDSLYVRDGRDFFIIPL